MNEVAVPKRGEIWMVDFSPGRGSEQLGTRPAVVIQNDTGNQSRRYPNTIVLAMSTRGRPVPFHIRVEPSELNGLRETTWVKCEQVLTLSKSRLLGKALGRLTGSQMKKVEVAVKLSMALP
jgi:mRNA interferase MazF